MKITYSIHGGRRPTVAHERLEIDDDGSFTMWRSMSTMSSPPSSVGRFAGTLAPDALTALQRAASAADDAGDLDQSVPPDGGVVSVELAKAHALVGVHAELDGAWGTLLAQLHDQLGMLAAQPAAAVALDVDGGLAHASLRHVGAQAVTIDRTGGGVRVVVWRAGAKVGDWRSGPIGSGSVKATSGWSQDLPFDHQLTTNEGDKTDVYVNLTGDDDGRSVALQLFRRVE